MMDMGEVRGVITVLTMLCFFGIFWWAYRPGNRRRFDEDAMIPFLDDGADEVEWPTKRSAQVLGEGSESDE